MKDILGIAGGMGPLTSAEFLKTIYEYSLNEREQESPIVVMNSDPTFPDRTEAFLKGEDDILLQRLIKTLHDLRDFGASKMVICCITIHHLLPRLSYNLRRQIISLLDVIFEGLLRTQKKHLLICTNGTRKLGIFQNHRQWPLAKDYFVLLDDDDQIQTHNWIYRVLKRHGDVSKLIPFLESLLIKYQVNAFIAGCTEIHLVTKYLLSCNGNQKDYGCLDPLSIIAKGVSVAEWNMK